MKKLLLLITLISSLAFGAEPTTITFTFTQGEPVEFQLFSQEAEALKASQTLKNMFEFEGVKEKDREKEEPVDLPMSRSLFDTILDILSIRTDGQLTFASDQISDAAHQKILEKLARLNESELVDLIKASIFLEIETLFNIAGESLIDPKRLSSIIYDPLALEVLNTVSPEAGLDLITHLEQYKHSQSDEVKKIYSSLFNILFYKTPIPEHEIARSQGPIAVSQDGSLIAFVRPTSTSSSWLSLGITITDTNQRKERQLVLGGDSNEIVIYDTNQRKERILTKTLPQKCALDFSAQGNRLLVSSWDDLNRKWTATIWDTSSDSQIMAIQPSDAGRLQSMLLSAKGDILHLIYDTKIDAFSIPSGTLNSSFAIESTVRPFSTRIDFKLVNDRYLITVKNKAYKVYDIHAGALLQTFKIEGTHSLNNVTISPSGTCFAQLIDDTFILYRVADGEKLHTLPMEFEDPMFKNLPRQRVFSFSPDGSLLAALALLQGGINEYLWVWDTTTGNLKLSNLTHIDTRRDSLPELILSSSNQFVITDDNTEPVIFGLKHNVMRRIFKKSHVSRDPVVRSNSSVNTVINVMTNPDRIRYASLIPLYNNLQSIQQLSIQEYVILRALFRQYELIRLPDKIINYLKMTLSPLDKNLASILYEYYPELKPSSNEIQQIQPAQQEEPSLLGRLMRWLMRKGNT